MDKSNPSTTTNTTSTIQKGKPGVITPEIFARIINTDKILLNNISDLCFRRCIASFEKEYLNPME